MPPFYLRNGATSFLASAVMCGLSHAASFSADGVAVLQLGDGTAGLSTIENATSIAEYSASGGLLQTIPLPLKLGTVTTTPQGPRFTTDVDKFGLAVTGFLPPFSGDSGTNLHSRNVLQAPRAIVRINSEGVASTPISRLELATVNSATFNGLEAWVGMISNPGIYYVSPTYQLGGLSFSSGDVPKIIDSGGGIALFSPSNPDTTSIRYMAGLQRSAGHVISLFSFGSAITDIAMSLEKGVVYVASTTGTISKYILNNGAFELQRTFTTGSSSRIYGMTADLESTSPVLYAVNGAGLYRIADDGTSTAMTRIATAPSNRLFWAVQLAPKQKAKPPTLDIDETPPILFLASAKASGTKAYVRGLALDTASPARLQMRIGKRGKWRNIKMVNGSWRTAIQLPRTRRLVTVKFRALDEAGNMSPVVTRKIRTSR